MRRALTCVATVLLMAACGSGGDNTTASPSTTERSSTTEVGPTPTLVCPGFAIGEIHGAPAACLPGFLAATARDHDLVLEDDADEQARSLCRSIDVAGFPAGLLTVQADWETGAKSKPADDVTTFVPLAIAVYCPEHYQALRDSN